jgi:hypothetical protein
MCLNEIDDYHQRLPSMNSSPQTQCRFDLRHLFGRKQQVKKSIDLRLPLGHISKNNHALPGMNRRIRKVRTSAEVHHRFLVRPIAVQDLLNIIVDREKGRGLLP